MASSSQNTHSIDRYETSLPRCVYTIVSFPKMPAPLSHISSVAAPHLRRCHFHLPVSPYPLSLLSQKSSYVSIHQCLHCYPCLSSPIFRIYTASVVILLRLYFSSHHIIFHHPAPFAPVCLCVTASVLCLHPLYLYHSQIPTVPVLILPAISSSTVIVPRVSVTAIVAPLSPSHIFYRHLPL